MKFTSCVSLIVASLALALAAGPAQAVDAKAAEKLAKKNDCFKCHAISKKKDGPSYKEVAEKYKGKPNAEQDLFIHATTGPKVKVDGKEEDHKKTQADSPEEIRNLVRWILSQ